MLCSMGACASSFRVMGAHSSVAACAPASPLAAGPARLIWGAFRVRFDLPGLPGGADQEGVRC